MDDEEIEKLYQKYLLSRLFEEIEENYEYGICSLREYANKLRKEGDNDIMKK